MLFAHRITLTGSVMQLPNVEPKHGEVKFSTPSGNTDSMYFANDPANCGMASNRLEVPKSAEFTLKISNLNMIFIDGTSGDYLDVICEKK